MMDKFLCKHIKKQKPTVRDVLKYVADIVGTGFLYVFFGGGACFVAGFAALMSTGQTCSFWLTTILGLVLIVSVFVGGVILAGGYHVILVVFKILFDPILDKQVATCPNIKEKEEK